MVERVPARMFELDLQFTEPVVSFDNEWDPLFEGRWAVIVNKKAA